MTIHARARCVVVVMSLFLGIATGCTFEPLGPESPTTTFTKNQLTDVLDCQKKIKVEGANFIAKKLGALEGCVDRVLAARLAEQHSIGNPKEIMQQIVDAKKACEGDFAQILSASKKFVDAVLSSCADVEEEVLGPDYGDPLGFQRSGWWDPCDPEVVEDLAACLCAAYEIDVDILVTLHAPNAAGLVADLFGFSDGDDFTAWLHTTYLDPRCGDFSSFSDVSGILVSEICP
jgi:hypothetical protein